MVYRIYNIIESPDLCRSTSGGYYRLLAFGRKLVQKEGPRANISWTPDGQALYLYRSGGPERQWQSQQAIQLAAFREMARSAILECHRLTTELMFDWLPAVKPDSLTDNLTNTRVGYSYLSEPRNNLQHSFRGLLRRAWIEGYRLGTSGTSATATATSASSSSSRSSYFSVATLQVACRAVVPRSTL